MATFSSDTRCLGGQKQVMELMTGHYSALVNAKPTLNTFKKPFVHVSKQKRAQTAKKRPPTAAVKGPNEQWLDKLANDFGYQETRETFKRCNNIGSDIGHMTQNLGYKAQSKKLSQYRARKKSTYYEEEHMRNLAALRQRVQNVGNAQDRAKNKYDPLTHPVRFFRKSEAEAHKVSLGGFQKKIDNNLDAMKKRNDQLAQQWIQSSMETGRKKKPLREESAAMAQIAAAAAQD